MCHPDLKNEDKFQPFSESYILAIIIKRHWLGSEERFPFVIILITFTMLDNNRLTKQIKFIRILQWKRMNGKYACNHMVINDEN